MNKPQPLPAFEALQAGAKKAGKAGNVRPGEHRPPVHRDTLPPPKLTAAEWLAKHSGHS